MIFEEEKHVGGQLGRPSGARFRTYERLKQYATRCRARCSTRASSRPAIDDIYRYPAAADGADTLNRQLAAASPTSSSPSSSSPCATRVGSLASAGRGRGEEPQIICSLGSESRLARWPVIDRMPYGEARRVRASTALRRGARLGSLPGRRRRRRRRVVTSSRGRREARDGRVPRRARTAARRRTGEIEQA